MATAVSPSRQDYRVESPTNRTAGTKQLSTDEMQTPLTSSHSFSPTITLACGVGVTFSSRALKSDSTCGTNKITQQQNTTPQLWSSHFTECTTSVDKTKNPAQVDRAESVGIPFKKETWGIAQSKQINSGPRISLFEDVCYNKSCNTAGVSVGEAVRVGNNSAILYRQPTVHFSSATRSGGSVSKSDRLCSAVGQTDFGHGSSTNCSTRLVSCDSPSSPSPSCRLASNNAGCSCGSGNSSANNNNNIIGPSNMIDVFQLSPLTNENSMVSSTAYYSTLSAVDRLRVQPLRFKMLPSPVPYEMLFADNLSCPPLRQLAQYQAVMLRWYNHILVAQENTRARIRNHCPPPPEDVLQQIKPPNPEQLQEWSAQCCRWWEESSRRRTRRRHRGGKTSVGAAAARGAQQQPRHTPSCTNSSSCDVKELSVAQPALLRDLSLHTKTSPEEESNFNWNHLIDTIIGGDE